MGSATSIWDNAWPKAHLKWIVKNRTIKNLVVVMLNLNKVLIPCPWIIGVINSKDMHKSSHWIPLLVHQFVDEKEFNLANLVSIKDQKKIRKCLGNFCPYIREIVFGDPKSMQTHLNKSLVVPSIVTFFL